MKTYILSPGGRPAYEPDFKKWAVWFKKADRKVKHEKVGKSEVSTVFLGIDHVCNGGPPVLWETMVFGGKLDGEMARCSGQHEDAEEMHDRMVRRVRHLSKKSTKTLTHNTSRE